MAARDTKPRTDPLATPAGGWKASRRTIMDDKSLTQDENFAAFDRKEAEIQATRVAMAKSILSLNNDENFIITANTIRRAVDSLRGYEFALLRDLESRDRLPKKSESVARLRELIASAQRLRLALKHFGGNFGLLAFVANRTAFFEQVLPPKRVEYPLVQWHSILNRPLYYLEQLAVDELATLEELAAGAGHLRLHDRLYGDPRQSLAIRAACMVADWGGNDAVKATENGLVHRIVNMVWSLATGLDPEDYNLAAFVKKGVREWRRLRREGKPTPLWTDFNLLKKPRLRT